jgi:amino acid adenylation domain-containing protein
LIGAHMRDRGVFLLEGFPSYMTAAHDDDDIEHAIAAFKDAALEMRAGGMIVGHDSVAYGGPHRHKAPPRLSLPGGEAQITQAMLAPLVTIRVPSTEAQREIWAAMVVTPEIAPAYNESVTLTLRGQIDAEALVTAVKAGLTRHDAFRTTFSEDGLEMLVHPTASFDVPIVDLSGQSDQAQGAARQALITNEVATPFDMPSGPFVRARLVRLDTNWHDLILTAHHIVCDGWSIDVVMRDVGAIYAGITGDKSPDLPPVQSILDFARAEAEWANTPTAHAEAAYWIDQFKDMPPTIDLPTDVPRPAERTVRGARLDRALPDSLTADLRALAKSHGVTFVNILLAAWKVYIARAADLSDVVIGLPAAGQSGRGMPQVVGHCVNLLPIRTRIDWKKGFDTYLATVRAALLDAYDHQNHTYGALIRAMKLPRDSTRVMLVPVVFNIDKGIDLRAMRFGNTETEFVTNPRGFEHFDLYLNVTDTGTRVLTEWSYKSDLFKPDTIARHINSFTALLEALVRNPKGPLAQVSRSTPVGPMAPQSSPVGSTHSVPVAFAQAAGQYPDSVALVAADGKTLSYARLDQLSNALAARLQGEGVGLGDLVGVAAVRDWRTIVTLLAILKCGAAYVPLPAYFPEERLRLIALQCGLSVLVGTVPALDGMGLRTISLADLDNMSDSAPVSFTLPEGLSGESLAYVMYTSGSTGTPKGVMVPHRGIMRLVSGQDYMALGPDERILQNSPLAFDASTLEIWGALLNGGALVIAGADSATLDGLGQTLRRHNITSLWLTAGLFHAMADERPQDFATLRQLLTGGDVVQPDKVARVMAACPGLIVINGYGPTENTTFTCCYRIAPSDLVSGTALPIGKPIRGTEVFVLDAGLNIVAPGAEGELCIAGDGLAIGYLGRRDLTDVQFVDAPWQQGLRLYRSGDLVRQDADGVVHFLGRADTQVKIRGYRIELAEIEAALARHPAVRGVVVTAVALRGMAEKSLIAYVQLGMPTVSRQALLDHARALLPDYACPNYVIEISAIPLNSNGKVDWRALPLPEIDEAPDTIVGPLTPTEEQLSRIWADTLNLPSVAVEANFFELGGHSLNAVKLFSKIKRNFGVDLPISSLFAYPTVRGLATLIGDPAARPIPVLGAADRDNDWDTSVVIHPGPNGARRALFIVGGAGGTVNNLYELGQIVGKSRPLIGLQVRGVMGHRMHDSIEAMAADHIQHIRGHQPAGPYLIAGYSGGGFTAYEIARQLEAAGEQISFLGILDAYAPGFPPEMKTTKLRKRLNRLLTRPGTFARNGIVRLRNKVISARMANLLDPLIPEGARFIQAWGDAAEHYDPPPFKGNAWLFQTKPDTGITQAHLLTDPNYGWGNLVLGQIRRLEHQSDHFSMLMGDNAADLAKWIELSIAESTGTQP